MSKKTTLQQVREQMDELQKSKNERIAESNKKLEEIRAEIEEAAQAASEAAERADIDAYSAAEQKRQAAQTMHDMYTERLQQIRNQKYISEEESDKVIDSLLAYQDELAKDFLESIKPLVNELAALRKEYMNEVRETERTIREWTQRIHANYRTFGRTRYYNEATGNYTERSPKPIPVLLTLCEPCGEAQAVDELLKYATIKALISDDLRDNSNPFAAANLPGKYAGV